MAVLGALLMTVVIVSIAVTVGVRSARDIAATRRVFESDAANSIFRRLQGTARDLLETEAKSQPYDGLQDAWATQPLEARVDTAEGTGALSDLQGRFNLNDLAFDAGVASVPAQTSPAATTAGAATSATVPAVGTSAGTASAGMSTGSSSAPASTSQLSSTTAPAPAPASAGAAATDGLVQPPPGYALVERHLPTATGNISRYYGMVASSGTAASHVERAPASPAESLAMTALAGVSAVAANTFVTTNAAIPAAGTVTSPGSGAAAAPGQAGATVQLTPQQVAIARFQLLLQALNVTPDIIPAILDWLDSDSDTRFPNGAEDDYYMGLTPPYRAANRKFVDLSELRLVRGITDEIYRKLEPYVTVLPVYTEINVNTAPLPVLMSLGPGIDQTTAQLIADTRKAQPFHTVDEFTALPFLAGMPVAATGLTTRTSFFELDMQARSGDTGIDARAIIGRPSLDKTEIVMRTRGIGGG